MAKRKALHLNTNYAFFLFWSRSTFIVLFLLPLSLSVLGRMWSDLKVKIPGTKFPVCRVYPCMQDIQYAVCTTSFRNVDVNYWLGLFIHPDKCSSGEPQSQLSSLSSLLVERRKTDNCSIILPESFCSCVALNQW